MRLPVLAAVLAAGHAAPVLAQAVPLSAGAPSPAAQCRAAITVAERAAGVPDRLMQAIGVI